MSFQPDNMALREINEQDIDTLMELTGNPDVIKYLPGMIQDRKYAEKWIEGLTSDDHEYMILHGDTIIGECSLTVRNNSGEIGLMLFPEHWRHGYVLFVKFHDARIVTISAGEIADCRAA